MVKHIGMRYLVIKRDLPKKEFTKVLHELLSDILQRENDYIETPLIIKKLD